VVQVIYFFSSSSFLRYSYPNFLVIKELYVNVSISSSIPQAQSTSASSQVHAYPASETSFALVKLFHGYAFLLKGHSRPKTLFPHRPAMKEQTPSPMPAWKCWHTDVLVKASMSAHRSPQAESIL